MIAPRARRAGGDSAPTRRWRRRSRRRRRPSRARSRSRARRRSRGIGACAGRRRSGRKRVVRPLDPVALVETGAAATWPRRRRRAADLPRSPSRDEVARQEIPHASSGANARPHPATRGRARRALATAFAQSGQRMPRPAAARDAFRLPGASGGAPRSPRRRPGAPRARCRPSGSGCSTRSAAARAEARAESGVAQQRHHALRERAPVVGRDEEARDAVLHHLGRATPRGTRPRACRSDIASCGARGKPSSSDANTNTSARFSIGTLSASGR